MTEIEREQTKGQIKLLEYLVGIAMEEGDMLWRALLSEMHLRKTEELNRKDD